MLRLVLHPCVRLLVVALATVTVLPVAAQSLLSNQRARLTVAAEPPAVVVAGTPFTVALRLTPVPGVHVYAPGNPNYIPVTVEVTSAPGVKADAALFPPGQDLFFGPRRSW